MCRIAADNPVFAAVTSSISIDEDRTRLGEVILEVLAERRRPPPREQLEEEGAIEVPFLGDSGNGVTSRPIASVDCPFSGDLTEPVLEGPLMLEDEAPRLGVM